MTLDRISSLRVWRPSALFFCVFSCFWFVKNTLDVFKHQSSVCAELSFITTAWHWEEVWPLFALIHRCYFWDTLAEPWLLLCSTSAAWWFNWVLENSASSSSRPFYCNILASQKLVGNVSEMTWVTELIYNYVICELLFFLLKSDKT